MENICDSDFFGKDVKNTCGNFIKNVSHWSWHLWAAASV